MAVTKILARRARLDVILNYVLDGDKTADKSLTAHQRLTPGHEYERMMKTKHRYHKTDGVQCYHIIQSFVPGEIEPELALEVAKRFCAEHLPDYEAAIAVHIDKNHVHAVRPDRAMRKAV